MANLSKRALKLLAFMAETPRPHLFTLVDEDGKAIRIKRHRDDGRLSQCTGPWEAWQEIREFVMPGLAINEAGRAALRGEGVGNG
jgi:hypothetical protein